MSDTEIPEIKPPTPSPTINNETTGCPICLDPLSENDYLIRTLSCGHSFHQQCLSKLVISCPLCREPINQQFCLNCYKLINHVLAIVNADSIRKTYQLCHDCLIAKLSVKIQKLKSRQFGHLMAFQKMACAYGATEDALDDTIISPTTAWNSSRTLLSRFFQSETQTWSSQL